MAKFEIALSNLKSEISRVLNNPKDFNHHFNKIMRIGDDF